MKPLAFALAALALLSVPLQAAKESSSPDLAARAKAVVAVCRAKYLRAQKPASPVVPPPAPAPTPPAPTPPEPDKPAVKDCSCSSECVCGCNSGGGCRCLNQKRSAPSHASWGVQPVRVFQGSYVQECVGGS